MSRPRLPARYQRTRPDLLDGRGRAHVRATLAAAEDKHLRGHVSILSLPLELERPAPWGVWEDHVVEMCETCGAFLSIRHRDTARPTLVTHATNDLYCRQWVATRAAQTEGLDHARDCAPALRMAGVAVRVVPDVGLCRDDAGPQRLVGSPMAPAWATQIARARLTAARKRRLLRRLARDPVAAQIALRLGVDRLIDDARHP